jgi:hypothetical protein
MFYNVYANVLSTNPTQFIAGLNSGFLSGRALNGTNKRGVGPPTLQNATPIAIGTSWTEPTSGLVGGRTLPNVDTSNLPWNFIITVPPGSPSEFFKQAFEQGLLAFPLQLSASVVIA